MGGMALGRIKEIVDSYADANELYQEYLMTKWQKIALMQDSSSVGRYMKLLIGGSH